MTLAWLEQILRFMSSCLRLLGAAPQSFSRLRTWRVEDRPMRYLRRWKEAKLPRPNDGLYPAIEELWRLTFVPSRHRTMWRALEG